jgi:hypothetical protein
VACGVHVRTDVYCRPGPPAQPQLEIEPVLWSGVGYRAKNVGFKKIEDQIEILEVASSCGAF